MKTVSFLKNSLLQTFFGITCRSIFCLILNAFSITIKIKGYSMGVFFNTKYVFPTLVHGNQNVILNWFLIILNIHACMIASKTRISTTNCFWNIHFIMCHSVLNQKPISNYVSLWNNNFLMHHCSIPCIYRELQLKNSLDFK